MDKTESEKLELILKAIYTRRCLRLKYFTSLPGAERMRLVEPHSISAMEQGAMARVYQREPSFGWRFFRVDLIGELEATELPFEYRIPIFNVEGRPHQQAVRARNEDAEAYARKVHAVLADLEVSPDEANALRDFQSRHGLSADEVRGVHYGIFSDCLQTAVQDGILSTEEVAALRDLNRCLHACGAGVLE